MLARMLGKEEHLSFLVGVQTGTATMEIIPEDLQNLQIDVAQICSATPGDMPKVLCILL